MHRTPLLLLLLLIAPGEPVQAQVPAALESVASNPGTIEIQALVSKADALIVQNQYEEAMQLLGEAWALSGQGQAPGLARNILNTLATLCYNTGQLESATRYFQELVSLDEASGDQQGLSVSLFNLAHALASQQLFVDADRHFRRSLRLSQELGDISGAAFTLKALGVNAQATGILPQAETLLLSALEAFTSLHDETQQSAVLRHLGDLKLEAKQPQAAVEYYLQAVPVLAKLAFNSALLRTYRGLSNAYEQLGQYDKALVAQREYTELMQFDLEQQSQEGTQRMQAEFETRRYADTNASLNNVRKEQDLQLQASRQLVELQYLALGLGTGILGLILLMLYRSRQTARRMHMLASTDELTGLLNRRAILEKAREEWLRTHRFQRSFSCLMFDIDHFKSINDNHGHAAGDEVLKATSALLKNLLRQTDYVGRIGGEEFLVLTPETDGTQALILAERIRVAIQNAAIPAIGVRKLTVSIGIAGLREETSLEQLIRNADQALYVAKDSGRNRCITWQEHIQHEQQQLLHAAYA
jgi:diguanylate cyclase (GGDEF)-like protein